MAPLGSKIILEPSNPSYEPMSFDSDEVVSSRRGGGHSQKVSEMKTGIRYILHVDADAFFASVEQAVHPELKGLPVIVGGSDRGVVSAASYEARRFGVHSAMPIVQARKLCPQAVFRDPDFQIYTDFSRRMFYIMRNYSPAVEVTSVDEGYVDLTGTLKLHKAPAWEIAHRILSEIRADLDINVSGGLAGTRTGAKMATSLAKPSGLLYLESVAFGSNTEDFTSWVRSRESERRAKRSLKATRF